MKNVLIKLLVVSGLAGILCVICYLCYFFGYDKGQGVQARKNQEYIYEMAEADRELTILHKDDLSRQLLSPGAWTLEIHSPGGVVKEDVLISASRSNFMIATKNISSVPIEINGDTIYWKWDAGYSGSERYIGYIRKETISGNLYATGRGYMCRWILLPAKEGK